jgi:Uma2 family endonuclease
MGLPQPVRRYSVDEYYRHERSADYKSDYYDGEIFDMSGGTLAHSLICSNVIRQVGNQLADKPCVVFESNLRLRIKRTGLRTYPDASVFCEPAERDDEDSTGETYTNPSVIFEVLSQSTEAYDRGLKAENYRSIESLRAYLLISQYAPHVELYERQSDHTWRLSEVRGLDAVLAIPPVAITLRLAEVYARVEFIPTKPV